jgi:hypothetical protein
VTGKVVNLRQARKRKGREDKAKQADVNAAVHGLSKATVDLAKAREDKSKRDHDGHLRD